MKNRNLDHKDDWKTPEYILAPLKEEYGDMFDPCPYKHDMSWDGLEIEWKSVNFVNPPYSRKLKEAFIRKAHAEWKKGKTIVMLLPVSTSTAIFHDYIYGQADIHFFRGRIRFEGVNTAGEHVSDKCGMHDSMLVVYPQKTNS